MYNNSDARQRVLQRLKDRGPATVDELARDMGVVPVTMRSHLTALQHQGLVGAEDQRGHVGRPRRRFFLTDEAEARFPNRYSGLARDLLGSLQALAGRRGVQQVLDLAAARCASDYADHLPEQTFEERIAAVASILQTESGQATWDQDGERYVIHDFNCPYARLAGDGNDVCRYHTQVVSRLLGRPVSLEQSLAHGDHECAFAISARPVGVRTLSDGRLAPRRPG